ncbi:MAG: NAD(P)H-hydrate dehydratase [Usitatibacter sp.]
MALPILTSAQLRELETRLAGAAPPLMVRAGAAVADMARRLAGDTGAPILVVAGPGNNGGDAWIAALNLLETFHRVTVLDVTGLPARLDTAKLAKEAFTAKHGIVVHEWPLGLQPALIVDGLLGIGLARDVEAPFAAVIERINESGVPILAIDIPSGLDSESGRPRGAAVRATHTLTFLAHKVGLHTCDGPDHCGAITLEDLGAAELSATLGKGVLLAPDVVAPWMKRRARNSHKGDFGTLGIIGGNRGMVGAAILAGRAALLAGAGKVQVGLITPDAPQIDPQHPELMLRHVDDAMLSSVLVAGPGAGQSPSVTSVSMFERQLLPSAIASAKPLVLDADAINAVAVNISLQAQVAARNAPTIVTPHPAEAARLLKVTTAQVQQDRLTAALAMARKLNAFVVLKGVGSICASPSGRWSVNTTGNPALATGGTGDVLAGIIGALLCQKLEPWHALQYAVCLHGAAADSLVARGMGPVGLTASEVALECRRLMNIWTLRSH